MAKNYAKRDFKKHSVRKAKNNLGWLWLLTGILIGGFGFGLMFLKKNITIVTSAPTAPILPTKTAPAVVKQTPVAKTTTDDKTRYDFYTMLPNSPVQNQTVSDAPAIEAPALKVAKPLDQAEQSMFHQTSTAAPVKPNTMTAPIKTPSAPNMPAAENTSPAEPSDLNALKNTPVAAKPAPKKPLDEGIRYNIDTGSFNRYELADAHKAELTMAGYARIHIETYVKGNETRYRVLVGPYKTKTEADMQQKSLATEHFSNALIITP